MKPTIKLDFIDFWPSYDKVNNLFYTILSRRFTIEISSQPDFIIYSNYGFDHLNYDCYKIFYSGENVRVNWNACDFALNMDYLEHERYLRLPHWIFYADTRLLIKNKDFDPRAVLKEKSGFCCFIVGNPNAKKRIDFFNKLSRYKKVDSGGSFLNNVGKVYTQYEKMQFVPKYKFTIAFENSSYPGYTTEKVFQAMQGNTIPIYWGDPLVGRDFNTSSFINLPDFKNDDAAIQRIIELDSNDDEYCAMMSQPWYVNNELPESVHEEKILAFFEKAFASSGKFTPVSQTYRRHIYTMQLQWKRADYILNARLKYKSVFR